MGASPPPEVNRMWVVAGVLLGVVVLTTLVGFHSGPHVHAAAGVVGIVAAVWLAITAASGRSAPVAWLLFGVDLVLSGGIGILGWVGIKRRAATRSAFAVGVSAGAMGVALTDLTPDGVVRVGGEEWSAHAANGTVRAGTPVQVLTSGRVRLEVWGEPAVEAALEGQETTKQEKEQA